MSRNIKDVLAKLKKEQQEHPPRDYFQRPKVPDDPQKTQSDWSGSGWSGERASGRNQSGGRDR